MLTLVPDDIERYVERHTTPLPPHLEDLVKFTIDEMDYSIMLSGLVEGSLLQLLVWASRARRVLEIGCFTGFSAQMMAAALPEDGELITCEVDPGRAEVARTHFDSGPDGHKIEILVGPALETLRTVEGPSIWCSLTRTRRRTSPTMRGRWSCSQTADHRGRQRPVRRWGGGA